MSWFILSLQKSHKPMAEPHLFFRRFGVALFALILSVRLWASDENYNIPLWDSGKVRLAVGDGPLDGPFLTVFMPPENKRNGSAIVIAPGGSNIMLMYGVEGIEIAER